MAAPPNPAPHAKLRLLLVEDDPHVGRALLRLFATRGHRAALVANCALAAQQNGPFDCAVIDLNLPDGSGVDVADDLTSRGAARAVVFHTGATDPALLARARSRGTVVRKGEGLRDLEAAIRHAASRGAVTKTGRGNPTDE